MAVKAAARLINRARRPVVLAGHGVIISRAYDELRELAERARIPVVTTLLGMSSFPEDHELSLGFPGMHGLAWASLALDEADLIIAIGSRAIESLLPIVVTTWSSARATCHRRR